MKQLHRFNYWELPKFKRHLVSGVVAFVLMLLSPLVYSLQSVNNEPQIEILWLTTDTGPASDFRHKSPIEFPIELKAIRANTGKSSKLRSIEIAGSPSHYVGFVACNRHSALKPLIADINRNLAKLYQSDSFYQAHTRYLDEADIPKFDQLFKQVFTIAP